jgi:hypothetical protein
MYSIRRASIGPLFELFLQAFSIAKKASGESPPGRPKHDLPIKTWPQINIPIISLPYKKGFLFLDESKNLFRSL